MDDDDNNNLSEPYYGKALSKGDIATLKILYKPEISRCLADWGYSPEWDNNQYDGDYYEEDKKFENSSFKTQKKMKGPNHKVK